MGDPVTNQPVPEIDSDDVQLAVAPSGTPGAAVAVYDRKDSVTGARNVYLARSSGRFGLLGLPVDATTALSGSGWSSQALTYNLPNVPDPTPPPPPCTPGEDPFCDESPVPLFGQPQVVTDAGVTYIAFAEYQQVALLDDAQLHGNFRTTMLNAGGGIDQHVTLRVRHRQAIVSWPEFNTPISIGDGETDQTARCIAGQCSAHVQLSPRRSPQLPFVDVYLTDLLNSDRGLIAMVIGNGADYRVRPIC